MPAQTRIFTLIYIVNYAVAGVGVFEVRDFHTARQPTLGVSKLSNGLWLRNSEFHLADRDGVDYRLYRADKSRRA